MIDYSAILNIVNSELPNYGMTIKLISTSGVNVDASKPWKTDEAGVEVNLEYETVGISVPVSSVSEMGFKSTTIDLLKTSERVFIVAPGASGQNLETYNFLEASGIRSKIEVIDKLQPTDVALLYVVGVSR